ncbi:DUF5615 family PIN-like protein [Geminocystis herdmanii]|uniref:DUF5615 family PIN-like protein n=1 Tax=Geminocystis herdmanii TaxID=669359 RepID=UPI000344BB33|nr:DUF5615 family PIN-like protein [Geminocystis herdmanii]
MLKFNYLIDENLPPIYKQQLKLYLSNIEIIAIGDPNTPKKGTKDPEILIWCEKNNFILVTNNRASMPLHLKEHLTQGHHLPGIFVFRPQSKIGEIINDLVLIASASQGNEYVDMITYIPL